MPQTIDVHRDVPLPTDDAGRRACPHCNCSLSKLREHERIVEDVVPARVRVTAYHTTSGWCAQCRKVVESRAAEQPPAANLPHGQLGVNALATAATLRIVHRLPLRHVSRVLADLPGLTVSPAGIARQLQRVGRWLAPCYERILLELRASPRVHADRSGNWRLPRDETGWRTNGRNGYLWTLTNARHTLYHVDRSRSGRVILDLLGKSFGLEGGGKLVSDFYSVYDQLGGVQQKCLTHLLRALRDTTARSPELKRHPFFRKCKTLVRAMLKLKPLRQTLPPAAYAHRVTLLESRLDALIAARRDDDDADARRLSGRLRKYRDKLTTFLHHDDVDGTNNAAERALRPAVVMRKITGGSRSAAGAEAWAVLASVMRTAEQQGRDVLDTLKTLLKAAWAGKNIALLTDTS